MATHSRILTRWIDRGAWQATVHGVARVRHNLGTKPPPPEWQSRLPRWLSSKESASNVRDLGSIPGSGKSPEKEMATLSSILAWRIPWTGEPGRLQSIGSQRLGHDWSDLARTRKSYKRESWFEEMYKVSDWINGLGMAKIMTGVCECLWFGKRCSWWLLFPTEEKWSPLIRN